MSKLYRDCDADDLIKQYLSERSGTITLPPIVKLPRIRKPLTEPLEPSTVRTAWLAIIGSTGSLLFGIGWAVAYQDPVKRGFKIGGCLLILLTLNTLRSILSEHRKLVRQAKDHTGPS